MVTEEWVTEEVLKVVPNANVSVTDLHKSGDHFHVRVISSDYEGIRPLQRQRPLLSHFKSFIEQNIVHALDLKCMTPEQASKLPGDRVPARLANSDVGPDLPAVHPL